MLDQLKEKLSGFGDSLGGSTMDEAEKRKLLGQFLMAGGLGSGTGLGAGLGVLGGLLANRAGKREGEIEDALSMGPPGWLSNGR